MSSSPALSSHRAGARGLGARSALLATLVATIWGVNFVVIDLGLGDIPPTLFAAVRFTLVVGPAVFLVPRPRARWRDVVAVGFFMSLGQCALLYTAIALGMPAGLASLVLQAQVVLTVVFASVALRERPTRAQVAGVVVGVAGLAVVAAGRGTVVPATGFVLTLAAASSWAVGNVVSRRAGSRTGSTAGSRPGGALEGLSMTVWSATVVPVPLFALSLLLDGPRAVGHALAHPTLAAVLSTLYTTYLASLVGYGLWNTLLARHPAAAVVPFTMLVPPVGMAAAWLVLAETPTATEVAGGVLLLVGVAVTTGVAGRAARALRPGAAPSGRRAGAPGPAVPDAGHDEPLLEAR